MGFGHILEFTDFPPQSLVCLQFPMQNWSRGKVHLRCFLRPCLSKKKSDYISHIQQEAQVGKPLEYKIAYLKGTQW